MEEWILDDLLECSVCLERLDTSSKVLPCQHTFCKKCLEEISRTHSELRCPECRILVETSIDDLPPNVLLMRILEGIRNVAPDHPTYKPQPNLRRSNESHQSANIDKPCNKPLNLPCAKAIYDYISNEPGDLSFKKGDVIYLRKKVDSNWYKGDLNGRIGVFPANYVQIIEPLLSQVPQCKALYDFKMSNDKEEGCLTFNKGEIITVIRRVDENWAQGELNKKTGIFPIAFVELNAFARALMKLPLESQPGPSRVAPPPPGIAEDSFALAGQAPQVTPSAFVTTPFHTSTVGALPTSDSSSTSMTSPSSTSNSTTPTTSTSTSSHTSPSSPPHAAIPVSPTFGPKRHSFGLKIPNGSKIISKRHSAEILSSHDSSHEPQSLPLDLPSAQCGNPVLERRGSQRSKRSTEGLVPAIPGPQVQHSSLQLPALYVALYPYKPGNSDELELKRGAIYTVTERCQDGWYKGQHVRTQKTGVFPGNYVAPSKSLPALQAQRRGLYRPKPQGYGSIPLNGTPPLEPRNPITYLKPHPISSHKELRGSAEWPPCSYLPLTSSSTVNPPPNVSVPSVSPRSCEKSKEKKEKSGGLMRRLAGMKKSKSPPSTPYSMDNPVFEDSSVPISPPVHVRSGSCPTQLISQSSVETQHFSPNSSHRSKVKERPSIARISPGVPPETRTVDHRKSSSMDTPSSEAPNVSQAMSSWSLASADPISTSSLVPFVNVIDIPKSSQSKVVLAYELSGDTKTSKVESTSRNPPHDELMYTLASSLHTRSSSDGNKTPKRLSQNFEPTGSQSQSQPSKSQSKSLPVRRERFRCIVPYPPNSEYELELLLGDVIYVHKKRDDGWYKGTQVRTGRIGLFPASFVQSF